MKAVLRTAAYIALVVGALGSVALMLWVGHRNQSVILMLLFAIWDLSPYVGLALASRGSRNWPAVADVPVHLLSLAIALVSLGLYANVAFGPPRPQPAFYFLVVPLGSWFAMALILPAARAMARRQKS